MKWTDEAVKMLENAWNAQDAENSYNDAAWAKYFGTTEMAIAKARSNLGLVHHKVPYHTRDAKPAKILLRAPDFVLFYEKDGQHHFSRVDAQDVFRAKAQGRAIMQRLGVTEVIVLQPAYKLVMPKVTEIEIKL